MARAKTKPRLSLTDAIIREACDIVREGNFRYVAAARLGILYPTWCSWIRRGKNEIEDYTKGKRKTLGLKGKLVVELEKAEAECHDKLIQDVAHHGSPELKLKFLKMRYGKLYNNNPNAIDDETGDVVERSAADIIAEKLSAFLTDDDDVDDV